MCDPIAIASTAITGVSQIAAHKADVSATRQQNTYNTQARIAAAEATAQQYVQIGLRTRQEIESAAEEKFQVTQETRAAQATALMAAGEGGVSGFSVANLIQEFAGQQGRYNASVDKQLSWNAQQAEMNMRGVEAQGQDRANSAPALSKPSFLSAGLRIAGAGLGAYTDYNQRKYAEGL